MLLSSIKLIRLTFIFCLIALLISVCGSKSLNKKGFPKILEIRSVTSGPKHHFASAYYHTCSWSASERYLLCLETDIADHNPTADETATIGMINLNNYNFIPLAKTYAWNFQQGAMQHWLGTYPDSNIIYNDCRNGRFVSVILNVHTKEERILGRPVSAVSNSGKTAVSLNFARLHITRPGYGYAGNGDDPKLDDTYPSDDGLFIIDLETGESKLIVSLADIYALSPPPPEIEGPLLWMNHTVYNHDDTRIFFMARTNKSGGIRLTAGFTVNLDGSDLRCVLPFSWGASHYDWLSPEKLMVTTRYQGKLFSHLLFTDGKEDYRILGAGILTKDGHGVFSPDGRWMVTDTYPDELRMRTLMLMDMENDAVLPIGRFYAPPEIDGPPRCDLHPRWNHTSDKICFDSFHENTRQVYMVKLDWGSN